MSRRQCLLTRERKEDVANRPDATATTFTEMADAQDRALPGEVLAKSACAVV